MLDSRPALKKRRRDHTPRKPRKWLIYLFGVLVLGLLAGGGWAMRGRLSPAKVDTRQQVIQVAQMLVRQNVDQDLQTTFAGEEETTVEPLSENKFFVRGWVDLVTKQGRPDRQNFSLVVYKNSAESWIGENISVLP